MAVYNPVITSHHVKKEGAGKIVQASWQQENEYFMGSNCAAFLTIIEWQHKEAAEIWYEDFYKSMMKSYKRLGHKIDGPRATTLSVESVFIKFTTYRTFEEDDTGS